MWRIASTGQGAMLVATTSVAPANDHRESPMHLSISRFCMQFALSEAWILSVAQHARTPFLFRTDVGYVVNVHAFLVYCDEQGIVLPNDPRRPTVDAMLPPYPYHQMAVPPPYPPASQAVPPGAWPGYYPQPSRLPEHDGSYHRPAVLRVRQAEIVADDHAVTAARRPLAHRERPSGPGMNEDDLANDAGADIVADDDGTEATVRPRRRQRDDAGAGRQRGGRRP
jgi:hypothetical protein